MYNAFQPSCAEVVQWILSDALTEEAAFVVHMIAIKKGGFIPIINFYKCSDQKVQWILSDAFTEEAKFSVHIIAIKKGCFIPIINSYICSDQKAKF